MASRSSTQDRLKAYPGLTKEKLEESEAVGFSGHQLARINSQAIKRIDERLATFTLNKRGPQTPPNVKELRLVLLGKTGAGKSATGNLITGKTTFTESPLSRSCTATIEVEKCEVDGIKVTVIDTPGIIDTERKTDDILTEIAKVIDIFSNGIHGFLFVFNFGNPRFTEEEKLAFKQIQDGLFGKKFLDYCFVIITNGNHLACHETLATFLQSERSSDFGHLLNNTVKKRVIAVENSEETIYGRMEQRQQIVRLIASNMSGVYIDDVFKELKKMKTKALLEMEPSTEKFITETVVTKVMERELLDPRMKDAVREAVTIALREKRRRLTHPTILQKIKKFAVPLLTAAGQIIGGALGMFFGL